MAVAAGVIFPGIAPVGAGADDRYWGVCDGRVVARGFHQRLTEIAGSELAQTELGGAEMVDAGREARRVLDAWHSSARKITADDVEFDFVKGSGASGGAKKGFSLRMFLAPNNPCRKEQ